MSQQVISPSDLANTYSVQIYRGSYENGWDCVTDYQRVMQYHQNNPEKSPYQTHQELDVPRKRVRGWFEGSVPNPVRAVNLGEENEWFDATWDSEIGRAFNVLVTWIYASGSIGSKDFVPHFVIDTDELGLFVQTALGFVGYGATVKREDDPNRATEVLPSGDKKGVLGRALSVIGAPVGPKASAADITLPPYLDSAPDSIRCEFVENYVGLRGSKSKNREGIEVRESRPQRYHQQLAELIEAVTGGTATHLVSEDGLWLPAKTVSNLDLDLSW